MLWQCAQAVKHHILIMMLMCKDADVALLEYPKLLPESLYVLCRNIPYHKFALIACAYVCVISSKICKKRSAKVTRTCMMKAKVQYAFVVR